MSQRDQLISWLNDAHAVEIAQFETLQRQAKDSVDFPDVQNGFLGHAEQTRQHAAKIEECLELIGGRLSAGKTLFADILGRIQGRSTTLYQDQVVKNVLMAYAAEHLEIGCYQCLITAAEELGESQIAEICRGILSEEEAMAAWAEERVVTTTRDFLRKQPMLQP